MELHNRRRGRVAQEMYKISNPSVAAVLDGCPGRLRPKVLDLRRLILETAEETDGVGRLEETLRWGEPSYITAESRSGSTIRIGWNGPNPDQYGLCFHCGTKLVDTFREIFGNKFRYDGNRAILFRIGEVLPEAELRHCIALGLTYHRVKHLPLLGT